MPAKRRTQFDPLLVFELTQTSFHAPMHGQTYYELVYIVSGKGTHIQNNTRNKYRDGDLFLISPEDEHYFDIASNTHFIFILFTQAFLNENLFYKFEQKGIVILPEDLMRNKALKETPIRLEKPFDVIVASAFENTLELFSARRQSDSRKHILMQLAVVFGLVAEAAGQRRVQLSNETNDNDALISYINRYIYSPAKIRATLVADRFNISRSYFGAWFKKSFGLSYRDYTNSYKIKLIEERLKIQSLTLKQIAAEFGFNDESHLSHYFKSVRKISPAVFREQLKAA